MATKFPSEARATGVEDGPDGRPRIVGEYEGRQVTATVGDGLAHAVSRRSEKGEEWFRARLTTLLIHNLDGWDYGPGPEDTVGGFDS